MRIPMTLLATTLLATAMVAVLADDPPKPPTTIVQVYLDGKAGTPHETIPTDQVFGEVSSVPKFKYDYSGGRKDLGKVSTTIVNIFKVEGDKNTPLYAIMSPTGGAIAAGTEVDWGKLPEGFKAMHFATGKQTDGIEALPAGTYLATFVIAAADGSGTVRLHFTVK